MRNMSFMLTTGQVRAKAKTVTRRLGWVKLQPHELVRAVEKCMGLKPGEKIRPITTIRVLSVRREPLDALMADPVYGSAECAREGFGDHPALSRPGEFVRFFCDSHRGCTPQTTVTRIEFEYVD